MNVSWERLDTSLITGYIVYYSPKENNGEEKSLNVSSLQNSVIVRGLTTDVEYQFQVVAVAELDGEVVMGVRSNVLIASPTPPPTTPTEGQCELEH